MNSMGELLPEEKTDRGLVLLACFLVLVTGYFLFFHRNRIGIGSDAVLIGKIQSEGVIRLRHARNLRWGESDRETDIYLKDTVYTPRGTTAEFQWGDKKFLLEPESLVQFDEASLDRLEITLMEGKIRVDAKDAASVGISKPPVVSIFHFKGQELGYVPDINPLVIKHSELSSRTADLLGKKTDLEPLRAVMVPKLYLNQLSDYKVVLVGPQEKTYRFDGKSLLDFRWMPLPLPGVEYQIQVSTTASFKNATGVRTPLSQSVILFDQPGQFVWKIIARWRREEIESDSRKIALGLDSGDPIPHRGISTDVKAVPGRKDALKAPPANQSIKPEQPKTPFEILFGK